MDYMKFDGFMGGAVSRLINKAIENKLGSSPSIRISELNVKEAPNGHRPNGDMEVSLKFSIDKDDFELFIEDITK